MEEIEFHCLEAEKKNSLSIYVTYLQVEWIECQSWNIDQLPAEDDMMMRRREINHPNKKHKFYFKGQEY